jgi:hypothetical protein
VDAGGGEMMRLCSSRSRRGVRAAPLGLTDGLFAVLIANAQDTNAYDHNRRRAGMPPA